MPQQEVTDQPQPSETPQDQPADQDLTGQLQQLSMTDLRQALIDANVDPKIYEQPQYKGKNNKQNLIDLVIKHTE